MGGGSWDASTYASTTRAKVDAGTTFAYTKSTKSARPADWKAHTALDPKVVAGPDSPFAGSVMRESRDNADHPNALPIVVGFDQTGSMGEVPTITQKKLEGLFGLLLRQGYAEDPQVMVAAYGDHKTDYVPLQISQFEDDNRIDENLDKIFIESNGGANSAESMSLIWYYLAYHTATDAWDKRKKKGYAFLIADEVSHDLDAKAVKDLIGDDQPLGELDVQSLANAVSEKWDVRVLLIDNFAAKIQGSEKFYKKLFGEDHVLVLEDPASVTETIALAIGALEGNIDIDDSAVDDLKSTGTSSDLAIRSAINATSHLKSFAKGGLVVPGQMDVDLGPSGTSRL